MNTIKAVFDIKSSALEMTHEVWGSFFWILEAHPIAHTIPFILILAYSSETIFDNSFKDFFDELKGTILYCDVDLQ